VMPNWIVHSIFRKNGRFGDAVFALSLGSIFQWHLLESMAENGYQVGVRSIAAPSRNNSKLRSYIDFPCRYSHETKLFKLKDSERMR
jgi:hypothetical protein